ncbi:RND transporter [Burkholderia sp. MSMB617WGS]|uniref:efflux transporter outer membrane subunit n=1 Tax=Burkholderia sp. MSMB617WGS TaxID=1637831 RepID=UPI000760063E|nr:efflux transporter outer membrane subunit [Burkholderia sp. MSMB617WGS]AOK49241.1 RND transporter [Burkholderia sp. MSMB617WGS]
MCTSRRIDRARRRRRLRFAAIALGGAALVAGCAVGPDFVRPGPPRVDAYVPDAAARTSFTAGGATQTLAPDAPLPDAWWRLFGSREIDAAVDDAFAGSPTLDGAQATLRRSEHELMAGAGVFYPQIDAQAGASRQRNVPLRTGTNLPASIFNLFTLSTTISYALDIWGGERRNVEGLAAQADAQRQALAAARLTLAANVVNTMIARAAYADEVAVTRELIALTDEQIRLTRAQVSAGTSAYSAVLALESARASLDASLPALEQKIGQADDLLATLAGRFPAERTPPTLSLADIALPAQLPQTVPSGLVRRRPDILQAEAALHAASANVGVATAALFPSVTLSASGGFNATQLPSLFAASGKAWSVGASITAPLFHGGALWYQRKAAIDAFDESNAAYRQVVLSAFAQVADTLRALDHDAAGLDAQLRAMDAAREALRLVTIEYETGAAGYLQVLATDQQYRQARLAWVQASAQRLQDTVALYAALGGGWDDSRTP